MAQTGINPTKSPQNLEYDVEIAMYVPAYTTRWHDVIMWVYFFLCRRKPIFFFFDFDSMSSESPDQVSTIIDHGTMSIAIHQKRQPTNWRYKSIASLWVLVNSQCTWIRVEKELGHKQRKSTADITNSKVSRGASIYARKYLI